MLIKTFAKGYGYMFKSRKNRKQQMVDTIISSETIVEGKITHPTSLRIDGKIYGKVKCEGDVYIGKTGHVEPSITARNILIAGKVNGEVHALEKVHIQPSGSLTGSSTTKGLIIDDGGIFNGESIITTDEKEPQISQPKVKPIKE